MTPRRQQSIARGTMRAAAAAIAVCAAVLLTDELVMRLRKPGEDKRIADLQEQVKTNASLAPKLAAENDGITRARRARKARNNVIPVALIAASAVFLLASGRLRSLAGSKPVALDIIRKVKSPQAGIQKGNGHVRHRQPASASPAALDLSAVDEIVRREGTGKEAAIPILQAIQAHYRHLPEEALRRVCELTSIPPAQICGTSTFYSRFRRSPTGEHMVRVCHGTACHVSGARGITEELRRYLEIPEGADTDAQRRFTLDEVACLGCCSLAPVLMVDDATAGKLTPKAACEALGMAEKESG
ncbi:MAG: NAD(P)H-dependent oxidoreductase subunit E [Bryobacterales bacterium]|nr:NAD(P)H-dependent oxidoreductase subunit E [Bryobacterales bacterium]